MIGVGINENVIIDNVEHLDKDGKKSILITFRGKTEQSLFEAMDSNEIGGAEEKLSLRIFPFKVPDKADMSQNQKQDRVVGDINKTRNQILHILEQFLPKDQIALNMYEGTGIGKGISNADFRQKLLQQSILDKIWNNTQMNFIRLLKPLCGRDELPMRLKLVRQSKEKHYPTLPMMMHPNSLPFLEPMTVPAAASRIKFSDYEIKEGLDKADQIPVSDADPLPEGADPDVMNAATGMEMFTPEE